MFRRNVQSLLAGFTALCVAFLLMVSSRSLAQGTSDNKQTPDKTDSPCLGDLSKWPSLLLAVQGGSGWSSPPNSGPTGYGGIKIGGAGFALDLGYDRVPAYHGFSAEMSGMLPVFRLPGPQKDETRNYLRVYGSPGLGYRVGGNGGTYASAKVIMVLFSDLRLTADSVKWSPYVELQHRFPLAYPASPLRGDNRIAFGIMMALCEHCGFN